MEDLIENRVIDKPLSRIQKLIGQRMSLSKRTKPCFYLKAKADITDLMAMRPKLRKTFNVKITTNTFYIYILAQAVKRYPLSVGLYKDDKIKIAPAANIGFAVNAPHGLVVPVIKNAHLKSLAEIAEQEKILTEKARDNQLILEEIEGETIALSNLGVYGIDSFFAIIPPPASSILSVGNVIREALPKNGRLQVRKTVNLAVVADRMVVNEFYAAEFLNFIKENLQNPQKLISVD